MPRNTSGLRRGGPGRPKGLLNKGNADLKAYAGQFTTEAIDGLVTIARGAKFPPQARVSAWKEVLDRGHGKAPQALTGADGGPLIAATVIHEHITG